MIENCQSLSRNDNEINLIILTWPPQTTQILIKAGKYKDK